VGRSRKDSSEKITKRIHASWNKKKDEKKEFRWQEIKKFKKKNFTGTEKKKKKKKHEDE